MAVNDGAETLGFMRPDGRRFDVFAVVGDGFRFLATAGSRSDGIRLLRDAGATQ